MDTTTPLPPPPPRDPRAHGQTGDPATAPPQGAVGGAGRTRLYRAPAGERIVGGVAAGVADALGVPTGVVRLLFIITTFFGGLGVLLYVLGLLTMPERPAGVAPGEADTGLQLDSAGSIVGVALIVIAVSILLADVGLWSPSVVWAVLLIAAGIFLYRRAGSSASRSAGSGTAAPSSPAARQPTLMGDPAASGHGGRGYGSPDYGGPGYRGPGGVEPTPPRAEPIPVRPRPRRPSSPLGRMTVAATLVVTGVALWLQQMGLVPLTGIQIGAAALATLGVGLVVGAFWGRARWLVAPAALLALPLVVAATLDVPFTVSAGERLVAPSTVADVAPAYRLGAGELEIDLSRLDLTGRTLELDASVGVGELLVTAPADATIEVTSRVTLGEQEFLGQSSSASGVRRTWVEPGIEGRGTIRLDADVVVGAVTIQRPDDELSGPQRIPTGDAVPTGSVAVPAPETT